MRIVTAVIVLAALMALVVHPAAVQAADAAAGKAVYAKKCQTCHGAEGQGNAGMAKALKVEIRALTSDEVQKKSDADLKKVTLEGMGKMKPVTGLGPSDIDNIILFIRSLKKK